MIKVKLPQLGWVIAIALVGILVGSGFQGPTLKFGTADMDKVLQSSDYWKTNETSFNAYANKVKDLLSFLQSHLYLSDDQLKTIQKLSLKDNPTPQDAAELNRVKDQAVADDAHYKELLLKTQTTPEEKTLMAQFSRYGDANKDAYGLVLQQANQEIDSRRQQILQSGMEKARTAVQTVGRAQGFTMVLSSAAAPYGANEVTEDAIKAMNAQK